MSVKVRFSASGYDTKTENYRTREKAVEAIEEDAAEVAAEHCGEVECYGDEWVAQTKGGEEIARWEIL